jgi:hypothetical protein
MIGHGWLEKASREAVSGSGREAGKAASIGFFWKEIFS